MTHISQLMRALQFGDSVLPVGAFSFSNGLESAIQQGIVTNLDTLRAFVATAMQQAATCDGLAVLHAYRAAQAHDLDLVCQIDWAVHNRKLNEEMRTMTVRMGRKLGEMTVHVATDPLVEQWLAAIRDEHTPGTYPIGQALVFSGLGLSEQDAFGVHQYGLASMMLGAALRLMRVSYLDAQSILFELNQQTEKTYQRIREMAWDDMASFQPTADILAAVHVKAHVRMFMN